MRHTLIELLYVAAGLATAALITWAAAWAYPLGRETIRWVGAGAMIAVLIVNVPALRDARAKDRAERK